MILPPSSKILITCPHGVPPVLSQEVLSLKLPVEAEYRTGVETSGSMVDAMLLNLHLRTGHRVLYVLQEFTAHDANSLYQVIVSLPWEELLPADGYVCVTSSVDTPSIRDTRFANLKCKDAIVDRIKKSCGRRPDSGGLRDHSVIHLYWKNERCVVYLDTSGEPLSRRGYRKIPLTAPMQETLAAAVVLTTGWDGRGTFINPMCGSGTLAIEAALIALDRAPGLLRSNFGFMHVRDFRAAQWHALREAAGKKIKRDLSCRIIASDISSQAVAAARGNAMTAGVDNSIDFVVAPFADAEPPEPPGIIVLNPEYGERMGDIEKLGDIYREIGDYFKQKCRGFRCFVFTGSRILEKKIGLKPDHVLTYYNGGIECKLLEFSIYEGSRKLKKLKSSIAGSKKPDAN